MRKAKINKRVLNLRGLLEALTDAGFPVKSVSNTLLSTTLWFDGLGPKDPEKFVQDWENAGPLVKKDEAKYVEVPKVVSVPVEVPEQIQAPDPVLPLEEELKPLPEVISCPKPIEFRESIPAMVLVPAPDPDVEFARALQSEFEKEQEAQSELKPETISFSEPLPKKNFWSRTFVKVMELAFGKKDKL